MSENVTRDSIFRLVREIYMGKWYPIVIGLFAVISSISGTEAIFCALTALAFFGACLLCDSARPLIITFCTFCFHLSGMHSPSLTVSAAYGSGDTDYLFTGWRLPFSIMSISLIVIGSVMFFVRNKCYTRMSIKRDILLLPIIILSAAFLLGGAFRSGYFSGLWLSLGETAVFSAFYFLFAYGFSEDERGEELSGYFSYISAIMSGVIICQLIHLFITSDIIFSDGGINKEGVMLGWGVWTLVGICLAMLIPAIFLGAMREGKSSFIYFGIAVATWIFALLTMSRGAQLFSTLVFAVCVIIAAFKSQHKLFYRIVSIAGVLLAIVTIILLSDKLGVIITAFVDDNGRAEHAKIAIENFLSSILFGVGFSGFESQTTLPQHYAPMGPLPAMAHCTPLQLLSATGLLGLLAYMLYRAASIVPVLRKPTIHKTLLFLGISVILLASLIDNFVFDVYPMFYSLIALAIIHKRKSD